MNFTQKVYILTILIFNIVFGSIEMYISIEYEDNECQIGKRANMNLSDWLFTRSIFNFVSTLLLLLSLICFEFQMLILYISVLIAYILNIIGFVILATPENSQCMENPMGIYCLVILALYILTPALNLSNDTISKLYSETDENKNKNKTTNLGNMKSVTKV